MQDRKYQAVIFDMDGVIADSEPVYFEAFNAVLRTVGKELSHELHAKAMGRSMEETWRVVADGLGLENYQQLAEDYRVHLVRTLAELHKTLPGVQETIGELKHRGVPLGLASSSLPEWIEALLRGTGLTGAFETIVSRVDAPRGKPAPDIYLLAAERLNKEPSSCIAFEDTPAGVQSAHNAGMFTIQTRSASSAFPPQPEADLVLDSLLQFDISLLQG